MKNKLKNNLDKILIYFFVLIQIIFDMLRTTSIVNFEIFGLSILELTNLVLVFIIFLIVLIKNPKHIKVYIIYFIILGIYMYLHYYNTTLFNIDAYKRQTPNFLSESYHILITQGIPLVMLLSIMNTKVSKEDITKLLTYLAFGISIFIVSLNILKLANLGYGSGQIKYTIFDWLTYNNNDYTALTSKGWFSSTNQISAILFMLLPITILLAFKERKGKNYIFLIIQVIAMYMLGTKVATFGIILSFIMVFLIYILTSLIQKEKMELKKNLPLIIITIFTFLLFIVSPLGYKYLREKEDYSEFKLNDDLKNIQKLNCSTINSTEENQDFLKNMIYKYKDEISLPDFVLDAYPVNYDYHYWCTFMQRDEIPFNDFREMKTNILKSIYQNNNNKYDKFLGMGYSLNFIYNEKDYYYQFYIYGILGILVLIGPFYLVSIGSGLEVLKKLKQKATFTNVTIIMTPFIGLLVAIMSGHVLERIFPLLVIALTTGLSYKYILEKK